MRLVKTLVSIGRFNTASVAVLRLHLGDVMLELDLEGADIAY